HYGITDLRRDGGANGPPLFKFNVNIMRFNYGFSFAGHNAIAHNLSLGPVEYLSIAVYERSEGVPLRIDFDANPALYSAADIADCRERVFWLLAAIADTAVAIARLEALSAAERRSPLEEGNATEQVLGGGTLVDALGAQAAARADAVAAVFEDARLSYGELEARANQLAHHLCGL